MSDTTISNLETTVKHIQKNNLAANKQLDDLLDFVKSTKDILPEPVIKIERLQLSYDCTPYPEILVQFKDEYSVFGAGVNYTVKAEDYNEIAKDTFVVKISERLAYFRNPEAA